MSGAEVNRAGLVQGTSGEPGEVRVHARERCIDIDIDLDIDIDIDIDILIY